MRRPRVTGDPVAVLAEHTNRLVRKFEYPDKDTVSHIEPGAGGGMAHILIVSTSEPEDIQNKADYVVTESNAGVELNEIFQALSAGGWSIWMAGRFVLNVDVEFPSGAWIRGLGHTSTAQPT